ncbi:MAG TPA: SRPBCC family protein [Acetobacteraceae bacterium]|nr:SRPBCC family protein [Acetobacteraceae bacterium]
MPDANAAVPPLVISRSFDAPRALVFRAWSTADHVRRWFSPEGFTVPEAEIDCRVGGVFAVCMRSPDAHLHWCRGRFTEVSPPDRLAFSTDVTDGDTLMFVAHTAVTFEEDGAGTRMTVRQSYDMPNDSFRWAAEGAPAGWRTTLDKFAREVARMRERSVVHDTFSIERVYDAAPATVFRALTDQDAKARWFGGGDDWTVLERTMDVRPGGRERAKGRWANGTVTLFDAVYFDVIPDTRLIYAYDMYINERKRSVSLATIELLPAGTGTRLIVTEQGAFLDGYEDAGSREHGTGFLLDRLGASLAG